MIKYLPWIFVAWLGLLIVLGALYVITGSWVYRLASALSLIGMAVYAGYAMGRADRHSAGR